MKKGLSLKKQVKYNLERKRIPSLQEFNVKGINWLVRNVESSVNNTIFKKIGKKMPVSQFFKDAKNYTAFRLKSVISYKDVFLENVGDEEKFESFKRLFSDMTQGVQADEDYLYITIEDNAGEEVSFITVVGVEMKKSGIYTFRAGDFKGNRFYFVSMPNLMGMMFTFDAVQKYTIDNLDEVLMSMYISKCLGFYPYKFYIHEEMIEKIPFFEGVDINDLSKSSVHMDDPSFLLTTGEDDGSGDEFVNHDDIFSFKRTFPKFSKSGLPALTSLQHINLWGKIYDRIVRENENETIMTKMINSDSSYARSFEDKKNVPKHIEEKMEQSLFLKDFKFVEYDELVDVEKIDVIENEWVELKKHINVPDISNQSLRFRRLGHHKANGLYFPQVDTMCIDINTSTSFIHEFFHLLDFNFGNIKGRRISEQFSFYKVKDLYEEAVYKNIEENNLEDVKKQLEGRSKYNKDYFFSDYEVFARCGELYLRDINTHLMGDLKEKGAFYPHDERLLEAIDKFFGNLLIDGKPIRK